MGSAPAVSHDAAMAILNSANKTVSNTGAVKFTPMSATDSTTEITELARALQNDPKLIYDYVHNNIDYVPYYGSLKGATLTYLDGSGNDFDQASLMIALLRASGYTARYIYGTMTIPGSQMANWLGVDQTWQAVSNVIASGGIPLTIYDDATTVMDRVWVKATINGTDYLFDPAFKTYNYTGKIDIGTAMGYNQTDFMSAAASGATIGSDSVKNMNEANIRSKLSAYATNLVNMIKSQYPNKEVSDIVSGRSILQATTTQYITSLPFSPTVSYTWDDIPATFITTLNIQHVGINYTFNTPDLSGKRLTLTYAGTNNHPEIRLDGTLIASGTTTSANSQYPFTITIDHPYPAYGANTNACNTSLGGGYGDQCVTYTPLSGKTYSIVYNFGGTSDALLQKRQQQLDNYQAQGLAKTSEAVLGETLTVMGQTWLKEVMLTNKLMAAITDTVPIMHHNIGFMAQESSYYIDVKIALTSMISKHNIDTDWQGHFKAFGLVASAFEHGILEQLMGTKVPGVSTMKLFQIANSTGRTIYYANSGNFTTGTNIKSKLVNYTAPNDLATLQSYIDSGNTLILPDNGKLQLGTWKGAGYIKKYSSGSTMSMGMIIGGGYNGGYASEPDVTADPVTVTSYTAPTYAVTPAPTTVACQATPAALPTDQFIPTSPYSCDPVDMASGAYFYDNIDLSLGGETPLGLAFNRSYDSGLNLKKSTLGFGWTHNYDIYLTLTSHGDPGLGSSQPSDTTAFIAALYTMTDLLKSQDTLQAWVSASLVSKWAVDQAISNAVVVNFGKKVMEFVLLADGSYASPPGSTTRLVKNGDGTYSLLERFGTRTDFNAADATTRIAKIAKITDVDGNPLTFTYTSGNLTNVKDAYNRTLTLTYTSGLISKVTDSTGRFVKYAYTNNELTSYTDPESKIWGYAYDPSGSHRMTGMTNPLHITTVANSYDTLGRIMSQTMPRQTQSDGSNSATSEFFFSGYAGAEKDPACHIMTYYFDQKGRNIAKRISSARNRRSSMTVKTI